jgi:raffinose/stachyose/melibiose transport system permease protein
MKAKKISNFLQNLLLALLCLPILYPLIWLVSNSLKTRPDMINNSWRIIPETIVWKNYLDAWEIGKIGQGFMNSLIVSAAAVALMIVVALFASYALARLKFWGRNAIMIMFLATWMMPAQVLIIPLFKLEAMMNIANTRIGLILPYAASTLPFAIFVLTTFIKTIPYEIEEASCIDGASRLRIILQIVAPLSKPALSAVIIFSFMQCWNEFFMALVMIKDPALKTLPLELLSFNGQWGQQDFTRLFAALVIICLPTIIVYIILQKQFIKGLTSGAIKA